MSKEIPASWAWVPMLDIIDYEGGSQPPKKDFIYEPRKGYVRLLQIRDFGDNPFPTYVPDSNRLKKVKADDLLLARYGGSSANNDSLGRVCAGLEGAYNVALAKLVFSREFLERDYVKYLFMGPWFKDKVGLNSRSCQTGFNRGDVVDIEFPVAPLNEQRRIVAKLEKLLSKADTSQKRLAKVPSLFKHFRQSVLAAACSGRLTADWRGKNQPIPQQAESDELPRNWKQVTLGEVLEVLTDYHANGSYESLKEHVTILSEKDYAIYVRATNLESKSFEGNAKYVSKAAYEFLSKSKVFGGEIIIGKIGNAGKIYLMPNLRAPCTLGMNLFLLRIKETAETKYIYYHLISPSSGEEIHQNVKGATNQSIDKKSIRGISINLPPVIEQQEIVYRVEKLFTLVDHIEARYGEANAQVNKLIQSILAKTFRGELVPQDPNDEPAEVLLGRIREQRSKKK